MKYNTTIVKVYFKQQGLPDVVTEHIFHHDRRWRFDFAFPLQKIALEVEGGIWIGGGHSRGSGVSKDMEKYNAAILLGWRVLRCTPSKLCTLETINMVRTLCQRTN